MRTGLLLGFVFFTLATSGCLNDDKPDPIASNSETTSSSTATTTPKIGTELPQPGAPTTISWNDCQGLGASFQRTESLMLDEGETPPGWEPGTAENDIYSFMVNKCERIALGDFERGPVSFLVEMHNAVNPPTACQEFNASYDDFNVLFSLWIDDPDVARFLAETYHLPVRLGTFSLDVETQGDSEVQRWGWTNGTNGESSITVIHPGGDEGRAPYTDRIAWHNGSAVSFLDLTEDRMLPFTPFPTAQGTLAPPMRYAERTPGPFVGFTSVWKTSDHQGAFYRFGDLGCNELLP